MSRRLLATPAAAVLALLAQAAGAADHCTYSQVGHLPLHYSGPSLEITTDGQVNGVPAEMLVDTGSWASSLTRTGVERHHLAPRRSSTYVTGVGGESQLYTARVQDIAVGPFHSGRTTMTVVAKTGYLPSYDAIIGANFLTETDLEISLVDKQLKFFRGSGCDNAFLGYWKGGAIAVPLLSAYHNGASPRVMVKINGQDVEAMIDSGAGTSTIELSAARRVGLQLDSPRVHRMADGGGIGEKRVAHWRARFDSFEIGTEKISNPELSVIDTDGSMDVEMLLGADFLRAHRVLFALSQSKLYLAYVGGAPFSVGGKMGPWVKQEAEAGNPDAQYVMARSYLGGDANEQQKAVGQGWLDKAVAGGSPYATEQVGDQLMQAGSYAQAAAQFRAALGKLPSDRYAALMLYLARERSGDAQAAVADLETAFEPSDGEWPTPVERFYLGRIDEAKLLSEAADKPWLARARTCEAKGYIVDWYMAHGDKARAEAMRESSKTECGVPSDKPAA